mmetsp:Transcript_61377/g.163218  ORF Transcript_61377/g.163218 Transcript_61377/m.163218 type:complete len:961 (-) Transcript_61377:386-3268(-)
MSHEGGLISTRRPHAVVPQTNVGPEVTSQLREHEQEDSTKPGDTTEHPPARHQILDGLKAKLDMLELKHHAPHVDKDRKECAIPDEMYDLMARVLADVKMLRSDVLAAVKRESAATRSHLEEMFESMAFNSAPTVNPAPTAEIVEDSIPVSQILDATEDGPFSSEELQRSFEYGSDSVAAEFSLAIANSDKITVQRLLKECGADPNKLSQNEIWCQQIKLTTHTPLCLALLTNDSDIILSLLEAGASPDSEYSYRCGINETEHTFNAGIAAVNNTNLDTLKLLVTYGLDVKKDCPRQHSTLLWHAAYTDNVHVVKYLVGLGLELEDACVYPDNPHRSHTPLHIASKFGNHDVVHVLLEHRADFNVIDGVTSPLEDAITGGFSQVVVELVGAGAETSLMWLEPSAVVTYSVAMGLRKSPRALNRATRKDMSSFFDVTGRLNRDLLAILLPVLFERMPTQSLRFWDQNMKDVKGDRVDNCVERCAFQLTLGRSVSIFGQRNLRFASGPHESEFQNMFLAGTSILQTKNEKFLNKLLPQKNKSTTHLVPAALFRCRVADLHTDFRLLLAISQSVRRETFKSSSCQAFVSYWWERERMPFRTMVDRVWQLIYLFLYAMVVAIYRYAPREEDGGFHLLWWSVILLLLAFITLSCGFEMCNEVLQAVGYHRQGFLSHYVLDWWNAMEFATIGFSSLTLSFQLVSLITGVYDDTTRYTVAVIIFWRWIHMTKHYTTGSFLGPVVLPILRASGEIIGFFFVVCVSLMAFFSGYLALVQDFAFWDIFFSSYRTAIFGDESLQHVEPNPLLDEQITANDRIQTELLQLPIDNLLISLVAFALGVVLMNIFIAVMSINYEKEYRMAWTSFIRARAGATVDMAAFGAGAEVFQRICCPHKRGNKKNTERSFLWMACDANNSEESADKDWLLHNPKAFGAAGAQDFGSQSISPFTSANTITPLARAFSNHRSL